MIGFERSDDYQPLFWVQGRPVHVTTLLVGLNVVSVIVFSILKGCGIFEPLYWLEYSPLAVLHGQIWRVATYVFSQEASIGFVFRMFLLFFLGREVERFFGRKMFASLYGGLTLIAPIVLMALYFLPRADAGDAQWINGGTLVLFGVFIAFTTVYPSVQIYFSIPSIWIAYALLAVATLAGVANHLWHPLIAFWFTVAFAYFATRYASVGSEAFGPLANWRLRLPRRKVPSVPAPRAKVRRAVDIVSRESDPRGRDVHDSIDPLLDKISKHGLGSLTHSERAVLEKARVSLLRKERGD